jgi:flagellar biosynthesis protein FlhG
MPADQAQGLRRLFAHRRARLLGVVGAGATGLVLEIAAALAAHSERVLLLDATCGDAAAALGLAARYELRHVMAGDRTLADVVLGGPAGLVVLPAHRALATLAERPVHEAERVIAELDRALDGVGMILVNGVPPALPHAGVLLSIAPTAAAITLAYTELKALSRRGHPKRCEVVIQGARSEAAALDAFDSVAITAARFLGMSLALAGTLPAAGPAAGTTSARALAVLRIAERLTGDPDADRQAVNL